MKALIELDDETKICRVSTPNGWQEINAYEVNQVGPDTYFILGSDSRALGWFEGGMAVGLIALLMFAIIAIIQVKGV